MKITVVSFQTYGDYVLKAPFIFELYRCYPEAEITVVTNPRGAKIYPNIDSRLQVVVLDKRNSLLQIISNVVQIPRSNVLYILDMHYVSSYLSIILRADKKVGWSQSVSYMYVGPEKGFIDSYSLSPTLSKILGLIFGSKKLRSPESLYEGHVELALLPNARIRDRLSEYRSPYAGTPADPKKRIYCAVFAGWVVKQLGIEQWRLLLQRLLTLLPSHDIIVDGPNDLFQFFHKTHRIIKLERNDNFADLFDLISSCDAVICSDSFITHVASLYDVPAVSFFGPASPHRFKPTGPGSVVLYHKPACSPCMQIRSDKMCLAGHKECLSLQQITVDEIGIAVVSAIAERRRIIAQTMYT